MNKFYFIIIIILPVLSMKYEKENIDFEKKEIYVCFKNIWVVGKLQ